MAVIALADAVSLECRNPRPLPRPPILQLAAVLWVMWSGLGSHTDYR